MENLSNIFLNDKSNQSSQITFAKKGIILKFVEIKKS